VVKKKLYFSCALTGLPREYRERMEDLREQFKEEYEVLGFCTADTPPETIYYHDIRQCVASCDIVLAVCDERSTGLGWEMGTAVEKHGKAVLAVAHKDSTVTGLVIGAEAHNPLFRLRRFENFSEIPVLLREFDASLS
jgi:nucleoside 2-deoxyribosyltransferase